tara:strand:- start:3297 stop:3812 length:516 start_codon:yes stop_codon:yes gene_type:complete
MIDFTRAFALTTAACLLPLAACEKIEEAEQAEEAKESKETLNEKVDMSTVDESKFGAPVQFTDPDALPAEDLGNVTLADGSTLAISIVGDKQSNALLQINIHHVSGPVPDTIRVWIGSRSGEGAIKNKAHGHDDHWHAEATFPDVITGRTMLWIEVPDADGKRVATGMPII